MSLRWKLSLAVFVAVFILIGTIFTISQLTFTRDFQKVEAQRAVEMAQRADNALSDRIKSLDTMNYDYAAWDDTYYFVQDPEKHQEYIKINLTDTTFSNVGLNFLLIYDNAGHTVYSRGYDLSNNTDMPIPDSLIARLSTGSLLHSSSVDDSSAGVMMLPEGPLLISSQPIVTSDGLGPVAGTFVMARFTDSTIISDLEKSVLLPVTIVSMTDIPSGLQEAQCASGISTSTYSKILDSKQIAGYSMVNDIANNPAIILKVVIPRDINARGLVTTRYFLISLVGIGIMFTLVINLLLGKIVTSRVHRVGTYIDDITGKGDFSKRLPVSGNDELAHLSEDMNNIVQSLQKSRNSEYKLRHMIESATDGIAFVSLDGVINDLNDSKVNLHGFTDKIDLKGTKVLDLVSPEDRLHARDNMEEALETGNIISGEYTMLKKDGTTFLAEIYVVVTKSEDTTSPIGFVISTKDRSNHKSEVTRQLDQIDNSYKSSTFLNS